MDEEIRGLGLSDSEDSNEGVTAGEILQSMEDIWLNEKLCPEILPHKMELVDILYLQIEEMEKNVELLPKINARRSAHELELKRIRFLLSSYLRVRLLKIETYAQVIAEQEQTRTNNNEEPYLSPSETAYLLSYKKMTDKYMSDVFTSIPGYVQDEYKEHPIKPNLNSFIFFHAKNTVDGVIVDNDNINEDVVDIKEGSKMIMSYSSVRNLLKNDDIQLI